MHTSFLLMLSATNYSVAPDFQASKLLFSQLIIFFALKILKSFNSVLN